MSSGLRVHHLDCLHVTTMHLGGQPLTCHVLHVHETEFRAAMQRKGIKARCRYRTLTWAHSPHWRTYAHEGEPWFGFEAVRSLEGLPDEIFYIPLPGHTMGHCGVVLNTEDGWLPGPVAGLTVSGGRREPPLTRQTGGTTLPPGKISA